MIVVPSEFICPITMEIMIHPVLTRYGHSFDRSAIMMWICSSNDVEGECPLTRKPLRLSDIINNYPLAGRITEWCKKNNYEIKKTGSMESIACNTNGEALDDDDDDGLLKHFFVSADFNKKRSSRRSPVTFQRSNSTSVLQNAPTGRFAEAAEQRRGKNFIRKAFSWSQRS